MIVKDVKISDLVPRYETPEANPNRMSEERFRSLVAVIAEVGFGQPIIVRKLPTGRFEIIDGHHRRLVALELGVGTVPAVILDVPEVTASALSVAFNRIRGDVSLNVAAEILRSLTESLESEQVAVLTGFSLSEVEALLATDTTATDLSDMVSVSEPLENDREEKPHVLEIRFATVELYRTVRRRLKKAAGKGGDLARGMLAVLGIDEEDLS